MSSMSLIEEASCRAEMSSTEVAKRSQESIESNSLNYYGSLELPSTCNCVQDIALASAIRSHM